MHGLIIIMHKLLIRYLSINNKSNYIILFRYAASTKSAIVCIGAQEMWKFCDMFFPGVKLTTFLENCGIGDLIVASFAGRNRLVAEAFVTEGKVRIDTHDFKAH